MSYTNGGWVIPPSGDPEMAIGLDYTGANGARNYSILSTLLQSETLIEIPAATSGSPGYIGLSQDLDVGAGQTIFCRHGLKVLQTAGAARGVRIGPASDGFTPVNFQAPIALAGQYATLRGVTVDAIDVNGANAQPYAAAYAASQVVFDQVNAMGGSTASFGDLGGGNGCPQLNLLNCTARNAASTVLSHNSNDALITGFRKLGQAMFGTQCDGSHVLGGHWTGGPSYNTQALSVVQFESVYFDSVYQSGPWVALLYINSATAKPVMFEGCKFYNNSSGQIDVIDCDPANTAPVEVTGGSITANTGVGANKWGALLTHPVAGSKFTPGAVQSASMAVDTLAAMFPSGFPTHYDFLEY